MATPFRTPAPTDARSRVLVVDADRDVLDGLARILSLDFAVETCGSTVVARKLVEKNTFDVVCIDYALSTMTGVELIASLPRAASVGVVLLAFRRDNCSGELLANPPSELPITVLHKPYAPQDLIDAVRRASSFARVRRALRGLQRPAARP